MYMFLKVLKNLDIILVILQIWKDELVSTMLVKLDRQKLTDLGSWFISKSLKVNLKHINEKWKLNPTKVG